MNFCQIRINYSDNTHVFYSELIAVFQTFFQNWGCCNWTIARKWHNGPHYFLTFAWEEGSPADDFEQIISLKINDFLKSYPSADYDVNKYRRVQKKLNSLESAGIDPEFTFGNNTWYFSRVNLSDLASRYESAEQWLSVFRTEAELQGIIMSHWMSSGEHESFAAKIMILLACVYPMMPGDSERPIYDCFLSYYSNFLYWFHTLPKEKGQIVLNRFDEQYEKSRKTYYALLDDLKEELNIENSIYGRLAKMLVARYSDFKILSERGVIHARSPHPKDLLLEKSSLSDFHQKLFYCEDGSGNQFCTEFIAYRWLLNIIYKNFPLINIAPITRQRLNYSIDRLQADHTGYIDGLRRLVIASARRAE